MSERCLPMLAARGELLGRCPEVDGNRFVDTNCMFFTPPAFGFLAYWFHMPRELSKAGAGDRWSRMAKLRQTALSGVYKLPSTAQKTAPV